MCTNCTHIFFDKNVLHKGSFFKVALIMGTAGACRGMELCQLFCDDVLDTGSCLLINIRNTKNKQDRSFIVKNSHSSSTDVVGLCRKYISLRPKSVKNNRFFLSYKKGKCSQQPVGKNLFGQFPKKIARFLNLPDSNLYTGHCFRRTSASLLADSGVNIDQLKRHGGWKSSAVAEGYVERSLNNKKQVSDQIFGQGISVQKEMSSMSISTPKNNPASTRQYDDTNIDIQIRNNSVDLQREVSENSRLNPNKKQRNDVDSLFNFAYCNGLNINVTVNNNYR